MKKLLLTVFLTLLTGLANANLLSITNPASPLYEDDDELKKEVLPIPDKKEYRQVYIHKVKKMTAAYSHTWFYDYKNQKYLMQKTSPNVKVKTIMNIPYNITKNHYEL